MIVVAIIGILAAIAIPAYQDFTIRSKVTELINAAGVCKTSVAEYYQSKGVFPGAADSGCSTVGTQNPRLRWLQPARASSVSTRAVVWPRS